MFFWTDWLLQFPCSEITQEWSHLYQYLPVQVHCDSTGQHTRVVSFLLLTQLMQWWDNIIPSLHIQLDQMPHSLLILGMKHLYTEPTHHPVDPQERDSFELLNVNTPLKLKSFLVSPSMPCVLCAGLKLHFNRNYWKYKTLSKRFWSILDNIDNGRGEE